MQNEAAVKVVPTSKDITSFLEDPLYGDLFFSSDSAMTLAENEPILSRINYGLVTTSFNVTGA